MSAEGPIIRTLLGIKGPGRKAEIVIWDTEQITIGRAPDSDIVVDEEDVSRNHCVLMRGTADYFAQDLDTSNGTEVNGCRLLKPHTLQTKDVVKVGEVEITFIRTKKEPASLGLDVVYSSQLKGFAGGAAAGGGPNPEATMLALGQSGPMGEFNIGEVGDFGFDGQGPGKITPEAPPMAPNLELDLGDDFAMPGEDPAAPPTPVAPPPATSVAPPPVAPPPATAVAPPPMTAVAPPPVTSVAPPPVAPGAQPAGAPGSMTVTLELSGLSPELQMAVAGLMGKVIDLSGLRVHIKGDDLI